jgi:TP901 family phage tail tape measure protein
MADENAPRDASAKEVLKAFNELKPELSAARRELAQTRGDLRAAKPGEPTVTRGGRGMPTEEEVTRGTQAIERQRTAMGGNVRAANEQLASLRAQSEELRKLTALADALGRRGLGMSQFSSTAPTVFPTGRSPYLAGGRPVTGTTAQDLAAVRAASQAAKDEILAEQTMLQRLASIGAQTFRTAPGAGILTVPGGIHLPPGAGQRPAAPGGLVIPAPGISGGAITPGERARQAELIEELRTRQRIRAEARATQAAVEAEARSLSQLLGMLVEEQDFQRRSLAARADAAQAAEREAAAQALINREYAAAHPGLAPGERRLAQAEYLGTPLGPIPGAPGRIPGSEARPAPFPISYVNQGPQFEQRAAEAEFGAYRSGRTAARDVAALNSELTRLGTVQAAASQQMRRHGALTTEFLTALARGETTVQEFGYHLTATAGKFAGWTAAAGGVYGVINALGKLKQGAVDTASGVNVINRVINNFNTDDAQQAFIDLSRQFNVPINTAVDAVYRMGQRFHTLPEAVEAARASLYSFKTGEVDVATSTENLLAIVNGFGLGASDLAKVYDQINQAQNTFGIRIGDTEAGLAKAAGTYRNAGGDLNFLLGLMVAIGRATNRSGQEIGTGIARGVNQIRQAKNQAKLESQGVDVDPENFQKTLQSALKAARRPGADLQTIATGLFGNQYARLIAPVLRDQTTLNKALSDTSPDKSKGSAQRELAKVLGEVNEQISKLGNGLERIGGLLAQTGGFDLLGGALHVLNGMEASVEHILELFNDIPAPLRHTLVILGEMRLLMGVISRSQAGAALADVSGLSFIGPSQAERNRREAVIGTRSVEQTAANAFEGAINASSMSKVQARAQRTLAESLRLEAERETNDVRATALRERSNQAMARYEELQAQAAAQEQLALQYQEAYTVATERRVALQKRQITAEEALAATAAAMPGGMVMMPGGKVVSAAESRTAVASRQYRAPIGPMPMLPRGEPITDYEAWAAHNVPGRYDESLGPQRHGVVQYPGPIGPMTAVEAQEHELANRSARVEEEVRGRAARLRAAGGEIKAAGTRLGAGIGNFISGMGIFGLGFTAYIIGDQIRQSIENATKGIEAQNRALDAVPHSYEALQNRAHQARDAAAHGAQHSFTTRALDFLIYGRGQGVERTQTAADVARANADQALIDARNRTRGSDVQNVGLANSEIAKAANNQATNARAFGETRADVNKAFDRYVRDASVSVEGISTGKADSQLLATLKRLRQQALSAFGSTANDPFAAFRGGVDAALAVMDNLSTRAGTFGTSGKDLDQLLRGATYVTAKYGASNAPDDVKKVNEAQQKLDAYLSQMANDLKAANDEIARHGSDRNLTRADITPAYLRGQASFEQRGTNQNYANYIRTLRNSLGHVRDGMKRQRDQLDKVNDAIALAEAQRSGDLQGLSDTPGGNRPARLFPGNNAAIDRQVERLKKKRDALRKQVKDANDAADRRAQKIQAQIDAAEEQQYQETQTRIQTRAAYSASIASDKSDAIAVQIRADGELVKAAMRYHGPDRWAKIMEALTQQNNDIAQQAQQNLSDIQQTGDLRTSGIIGVGSAFDRRRLQSQLHTAQSKLSAAKSEANYPGKKDDIAQAEIAVNNIRQQILEQAQQDAKDAHDLAQQLYDARRSIGLASITDPMQRLRYQLQTDQHELGLIKRSDFKSQKEYLIARYQQLAKVRQDQTDLQQQHIGDEYDTAKFEHDMGKLTDDAYIRQLRQIVHMKGITKQTKRQLLLEIHQLTDQNAGDLELNVGNVHLPSIYEIRRAMGGRSQRFGGPGQVTVHSNPTVHINVARSSDVPGVGEQVEQVINGPVRANMRAAGLIG